MKRFYFPLLIMLMSVFWLSTLSAQNPSIGMIDQSGGSVSGIAGTQFVIDVELGNPTTVTNLIGVSFNLEWSDSNHVDAVTSTAGAFFAPNPLFIAQNFNDHIEVGVSSTTGGKNGSGIAASCTLQVSQTVSTSTPVDFNLTNITALDGNGNPVVLDPQNNPTTITLVVNAPPQLTPIPDTSMSEGSTLDIPVSATDPDGDNISLTVNDPTTFGSFSDNGDGTGLITFTPGYNDAGSYPNIEVIATDDGSPSMADTIYFDLTVTDVPPPAKILISEIVVTPTEGEFVEIYNPGASAVDLTDYYITDATFASGNVFYYQIVEGGGGGGGFADWHARFPGGATIQADEYQTIALGGDSLFFDLYGVLPTYELYEDSTNFGNDVPDMLEATPGSINGQGGLTNGDEAVILYYWNGLNDLVMDVDYLIYDDAGSPPNEAVDKTGVSIDGPDLNTDSTQYLADTPIASQVPAASPGSGFSTHRIDYNEGAQTTSGGNGVTGADETSEDLNNTFTSNSLPSPNASLQQPPATVIIAAQIGGDSQYRSFWVNGSWDSSGVYDPNWSGPLVELNDNGLGPDAVAGDSIFTGSVVLAVDLVNTYDWWTGSEDDVNSFLENGMGFNVTSSDSVFTDTLLVDGDGGINQWVISLAGDFNGWNNSSDDMSRTGTVWSIIVSLTAGNQEYKYTVMHQWNAAYGQGGVGGAGVNYSFTAPQDGAYLFQFDDSDNSQSVTLVPLNPPRNLQASAGNQLVDLWWEAPLPADATEISYDDGTSEGNISIGTGAGADGDIAVRFTPNVYPSTLLGIRVWFATTTAAEAMNNIDYTIWDGDATNGPNTSLLSGPHAINRGGFEGIDVSAAGIQISADDFFVSFYEPSDSTMNMAWDTDSPSADRAWVNAPNLGLPWQPFSGLGAQFDNNVMIRAIVVEGSGPNARVVELAPSAKDAEQSILINKQLLKAKSAAMPQVSFGPVQFTNMVAQTSASGVLQTPSSGTSQSGAIRNASANLGAEQSKSITPKNIGGAGFTEGLTGYNIYRSDDSLTFTLIASVDTTMLNYTDNTVTNDSTYWYYVTADYDEGESDPSNVVKVTVGAPSEPLMSLTHTPGDLNVGIFNDGSIGAENAGFTGPGVTWKGQNGLFVGGPIFGTAASASVNGLIGSFGIFGDLLNVQSNFAGGFTSDSNFDQIAEAVLNDAGAPTPFGVEIIQRSYSNTGEEFVFIRYGFVNSTAAPLSSFYSGAFIDWDIDANTYASNSGGYELDRNLVYQYDTSGTPYYYGVAVLDGLAGYKTTSDSPSPTTREGSYTWISTPDPGPIPSPNDFRSWQGAGPVDIAPGDTAWFTFAIVAGDDLAGIRTHALEAAQKAASLGWTPPVGIEDPLSGLPMEFALDQNYPNPFNPTTTIRYALKENAEVTLQVYNVLGQLVRTLVNEKQTAGFKEVSWDGANEFGAKVSSGIYIYRIKANDFLKSRKMILLK